MENQTWHGADIRPLRAISSRRNPTRLASLPDRANAQRNAKHDQDKAESDPAKRDSQLQPVIVKRTPPQVWPGSFVELVNRGEGVRASPEHRKPLRDAGSFGKSPFDCSSYPRTWFSQSIGELLPSRGKRENPRMIKNREHAGANQGPPRVARQKNDRAEAIGKAASAISASPRLVEIIGADAMRTADGNSIM